MNKKVCVIILAAGKGTRMNSDLPKVLHEICGKPILSYILKTLERLTYIPIIVVGHQKELVQKEFGDKYTYAIQDEQLGTGHAVACVKSVIPKDTEIVLVLNGDDSAFYKSETIEDLINKHIANQNTISFRSLVLDDPTGLGRIKRDDQGRVVGIVEEKNATEEQRKIREINIGSYCFNNDFLWKSLPKLSKNKLTGEYYLTDLIEFAVSNNLIVEAYPLDDENEWIGVNTPEQLQKANKQMQKCLNSKRFGD